MPKNKVEGLPIEYFVLNPTSDSPYGRASRDALRVYASEIVSTIPDLAAGLTRLANTFGKKGPAETDKQGLVMKYFVLEPEHDTPVGVASRAALATYSQAIYGTNQLLAHETMGWVQQVRYRLGRN